MAAGEGAVQRDNRGGATAHAAAVGAAAVTASEKIPHWAAEYVGLPYLAGGRTREGLDCWGLARLALAERFGVDAPEYSGAAWSRESAPDVAAAMAREAAAWKPIPAGEEMPGDVVLLRVMGRPVHAGLVAAAGWMLHIEEGIDSCLERHGGLKWGRRVVGFYRWGGKC